MRAHGSDGRNGPRPEAFLGQCRGKRPHTSRRRANGEKRVMAAEGRDVSTLEPYRCPSCRKWHLGNRRRRP